MRSEFITMALILAGALCPSLVAAPRLLVEAPTWEFGCVTNATQLTHDFVIFNKGDTRLEIKRVVSSCDACLEVVMNEPVVAPNGSTVAHCRLDTRRLSGAVARIISIESNDPESVLSLIELRATVVPAYVVSPLELTLGGAADQRHNFVEVLPVKKLNAALSEVVCDNTNVVAGVVESPPGQYHVMARALASLPRGRSAFQVVVRSADSNDPPCRITGRLDYPEDYEVIPSGLVFEAKDEPQTRILWLRQHAAAFSLRDAVPSSGALHCEIDPDPATLDYRIYVEARHLAAMKGQPLKITLKGESPSHQGIDLPVAITIN